MKELVFSNQTKLSDLQNILGGCIFITNTPPTKEETEENVGLVWVSRIKFHEVKLISPREHNLFLIV